MATGSSSFGQSDTANEGRIQIEHIRIDTDLSSGNIDKIDVNRIKKWSIQRHALRDESAVTFYQHTKLGPLATLSLHHGNNNFSLLIFSVFSDDVKK